MGYSRVLDPLQVAFKIRAFAPKLEQVCLHSGVAVNNGQIFEGLVAPWLLTHSEVYYSYPLRSIFVLHSLDRDATSSRFVTDGVKKVVWVRQKWGMGQLEREEGMRDHWLARMRGEEGFWGLEGCATEKEVSTPDRWLRSIIW